MKTVALTLPKKKSLVKIQEMCDIDSRIPFAAYANDKTRGVVLFENGDYELYDSNVKAICVAKGNKEYVREDRRLTSKVIELLQEWLTIRYHENRTEYGGTSGCFEAKIDFFEFVFLLEACLPPKPIARTLFFQKAIDKYYYKLSERERTIIFERFKKDLNIEEEDSEWFYARYDPSNQYKVVTLYDNKKETHRAFLRDGKYYTQRNKSIAEEYIETIEQLPGMKITNK